MSKIDSTRLSQVLAALAKPKERVASSTASNPSFVEARKGTKDIEVLRARLQRRLRDLKQNNGDFRKTAPVVTVQEILCWEFGEGILEHPEFNGISKKVADTMLENQQLEKAIYNTLDRMMPTGNGS